MRKRAFVGAALAVAAAGLAVAPSTAQADARDCPPGEFCAWTLPDYKGEWGHWSGNADPWPEPIHDSDNSWVNHGFSNPGTPDHVKVWNGWGVNTLCLAPGQEVPHNPDAKERGSAHTWEHRC
ncbi:peptidase inhibitor family I36 protein [Streptomyces sp. 8N616]|uniref:peptidase inhibitor family I36 protein n=1 Tax=Streptomyces sp. 8N616 TaxID=3457414 RepID=UPI003FD50425